MPKKSRKAKIRASQRPVAAGYTPPPTAVGERTREPLMTRSSMAPVPVSSRAIGLPTFDYSYVYRDLRRIGVLAALFFGVMLLLWFLVEVQGIHIIPGVF